MLVCRQGLTYNRWRTKIIEVRQTSPKLNANSRKLNKLIHSPNMEPQNDGFPNGISYSRVPFSGSMLNFGEGRVRNWNGHLPPTCHVFPGVFQFPCWSFAGFLQPSWNSEKKNNTQTNELQIKSGHPEMNGSHSNHFPGAICQLSLGSRLIYIYIHTNRKLPEWKIGLHQTRDCLGFLSYKQLLL